MYNNNFDARGQKYDKYSGVLILLIAMSTVTSNFLRRLLRAYSYVL